MLRKAACLLQNAGMTPLSGCPGSGCEAGFALHHLINGGIK